MDGAREKSSRRGEDLSSSSSRKRAKRDGAESSGSPSDALQTFGLTNPMPECMHKIMGFLNIKDSFPLRGVCRQFRFQDSEDGETRDNLDVFRYCYLHEFSSDDTPSGFSSKAEFNHFMLVQDKVLERDCQDAATLQQVLANDTLHAEKQFDMWTKPVYYLRRALMNADNAECFAILVNSGYMRVSSTSAAEWLRRAIQGGRSAIVSYLEGYLLKEREQDPDFAPMCVTCGQSVAVLVCNRWQGCVHFPEGGEGDDSFEDATDFHCRSCVLKMRSSCQLCYKYLCADCDAQTNDLSFARCPSCKIKVCRTHSCVDSCNGCRSFVCKSCNVDDDWTDEAGLCSDCVQDTKEGNAQ